MFFTYILYSKSLDKYYVGSTENVSARLEKHLMGTTRFTKRARDWKVVYVESKRTRTEAVQTEKQIKRMKSRVYIQSLIK